MCIVAVVVVNLCFFLHVFVCVRAMRDPAAQVRQGLLCVVFLVCFARHLLWHSTPSIECRHCCCCGERGRAAPPRGAARDFMFVFTFAIQTSFCAQHSRQSYEGDACSHTMMKSALRRCP